MKKEIICSMTAVGLIGGLIFGYKTNPLDELCKEIDCTVTNHTEEFIEDDNGNIIDEKVIFSVVKLNYELKDQLEAIEDLKNQINQYLKEIDKNYSMIIEDINGEYITNAMYSEETDEVNYY